MLDEKTAKIIITMKYEEKGIKGVLELLENTENKFKTYSPDNDDKEWVKFIGSVITKLTLLTPLLTAKKLQAQREDLKEIGSYLQKLGKELIDYKIDKTPKKKDKIDEAVDNLFDVLFGEGED